MLKNSLLIFLLVALSGAALAANSGDFSGSVAVGAGYAGTVAAPTDGLAIQGVAAIGTSAANAGVALDLGNNTSSLLLPIGTTGTRPGTGLNGMMRYNSTTPAVEAYVNNAWTPLAGGTNSALTQLMPQGRVTLSSNTPVMTADVTGATTIYYSAYTGDNVFVYNGSAWTINSINGQLSLALDSNSGHTGYQQSGKNFDLFIGLNGGSPTLCTGPAWSTDTSRGTGAGTTEIQMLNGIWTNKNSMTCRFGSSSGDTFSCSANQCTLVGSMRATANGQTALKCHPGSSPGGTTNIAGISNAYNQVPLTCHESDGTGAWTYTTLNTWRVANNTTANSIAIISSLGQNPIYLSYTQNVSGSAAGFQTIIGLGKNSTTSTLVQSLMAAPTGTTANNWQTLTVNFSFYPSLGYNTYYPLEYCANGTCSFGLYGSSMIFNMITSY
ncbi:MAG: hypothetical protein WAO98_05810 [Alphaproteobacteria bacterium]